ncbi:hypothetical protein U0070_008038 [Myodes glareolus]|uniref:Uncharacterized protein n=1 Tax=Myodes glareolus TaxID=447135 RepID=A0AAW0HEE5_MYOGA
MIRDAVGTGPGGKRWRCQCWALKVPGGIGLLWLEHYQQHTSDDSVATISIRGQLECPGAQLAVGEAALLPGEVLAGDAE